MLWELSKTSIPNFVKKKNLGIGFYMDFFKEKVKWMIEKNEKLVWKTKNLKLH
jgi:hypothetical protein